MTRPDLRHNLFSPQNLRFSDAVAALIVIQEDGRYLMQLRDDKPGIFYPAHWGLFGGAVDEGEQPEQALHRELAEELNLKAKSITYFTELQFDVGRFDQGKKWRRFYEVSISVKDLPNLQLGEGTRMEAFTVDQLLVSQPVVPYDSFAIWLHHTHQSQTP